MKLGLLISAVLVAIFALVLLISMQPGTPDPATAATSPEKLAAVTLPDDLPAVGKPATSDEAYGPLYDRVLAYYPQHRAALAAEPPEQAVVDELVEMMVDAAAAGGASPGFLDAHIPMRVAAEPDFGAALETAWSLTLQEAQRRWDAGEKQQAIAAALAVWTLGERAFRDNVRLYPRMQGLNMLASAGMTLYEWRPEVPVREEDLAAWGAAADRIDVAWMPKVEIVRGVAPPIGDLVNIARHDGDRTFRIAALLQLGIMQYAPKGEANRRVIEAALAEAAGSDDPLIAEAADAARTFTVEQMRRLH